MKTALIALILATAILMATAAYAQAATTPPACGNGIQDGTETGVDCGGSCALTVGCVGDCGSSYVVDYCDGKDNDKDCLVDEDCKQDEGRTPVSGVAPSTGTPAPCYNSVQDSGEEGVDCGGNCLKDWMIESCDGVDNNKDCQVDEGGVCDAEKKTISGQEQQESEEVGQQPGKNITGSNTIKGAEVTVVGSAVESVGEAKTAVGKQDSRMQGSSVGGAAGGSSADSATHESSGTSALGNAGGVESPAGDDRQNEPDGKAGSSKELAIPIEEPAENAIGSAGEAVEGGFFKELFKKFFRLFGGKS